MRSLVIEDDASTLRTPPVIEPIDLQLWVAFPLRLMNSKARA